VTIFHLTFTLGKFLMSLAVILSYFSFERTTFAP